MKTLHILLTALMLLAATAMSSLAGGDLFGDEYLNCPHRLRLHNQIEDLTVDRDGECPCTVQVSWTATNPDTWGLGPNTYNTSIVVLLDDGSRVHRQNLPLGRQATSFANIQPDDRLKVQAALVTDTGQSAYIVSDILEASVGRLMPGPGFKTHIRFSWHPGSHGTFHYIGYGETFANYRAKGLITKPEIPSFRVGLVHGQGSYWNLKRSGFQSYVLNIRGEDGDVLPSGLDGPALNSDYAEQDRGIPNRLLMGKLTDTLDFTKDGTPLHNVRVNADGHIHTAMQKQPGNLDFTPNPVRPANQGLSFVSLGGSGDRLWAWPPDAYRDFPANVLGSDATYAIHAWAVNDEGEAISLVSTLTVHTRYRTLDVSSITDYLNQDTPVTDAHVVDFTVIE